MVTKSELLQQRDYQATERAEQAKLKEQEAKQRETKRQAKDMRRVETMLDTDLGKILETANAAGLSVIRLGHFHVWQRILESGGRTYWNQYHNHRSPFQFSPKKGHPPTTRLVEILKQAGFRVSFGTERYQHTKTAVGYISKSTDPMYYIQIDWKD